MRDRAEKITVAIFGVGLIGGSFAIALRKLGIAARIIGVESDPSHAARALELRLVDEILDVDSATKQSDLIIFATPVREIASQLPGVLDLVDRQVVMDTGSTKELIVDAIRSHPNRRRFVATHPMWGTEYSGPEAAMDGAFNERAAVICNQEESDGDALSLVKEIYQSLGMHLIYMNDKAHDIHVAYVSHISHITSFALANTVLEKEREEDAIFELASGGFESTVRLAKSNPQTWSSIFLQNRENVLDVLNEHISQLKKFKACLEKDNEEYLKELMINANRIKRILK